MPYVVALEAFHGPLGLLLYLLEEQQLNIYDIPIAAITDQYLAYLAETDDWDLNQLGDFMVMASYLLQIKIQLLLPRGLGQPSGETEDEVDPRQELVEKLLIYKCYRAAAHHLAARQEGKTDRVFYRQNEYTRPQEELSGDMGALVTAYRALWEKLGASRQSMEIPTQDINIEHKMEQLMAILAEGGRQYILFEELLERAANRKEFLGYFLALLELLRQHKVSAVQTGHQTDIRIYRQAGETYVNA